MDQQSDGSVDHGYPPARTPIARSRRGQGLVEFALVLPLLVILLSAILEFSLYSYLIARLQNVARDAARQGVVGATNAQIEAAVRQDAKPIPVDRVIVTVTGPTGSSVADTDRTTGNRLQVTVESPYLMMTPLAALVDRSSLPPLRLRATFRIE